MIDVDAVDTETGLVAYGQQYNALRPTFKHKPYVSNVHL